MDLDEYQEAARVSLDEKVLLVAPPGSGKTTVLLAKIDYLITERGVAPGEILVLTFSRSASANLKARFSKLREATPFFGTMHSFAYRELCRSGRGSLALITDSQALSSLNALRSRYHLTAEEAGAALSDISRERCLGQVNAELPRKFRGEVRHAYLQYKMEHGLLDFDDLEDGLLELLAKESCRRELQQRYRWILVDEFQDLNRVQLDILKIIAEKASLFCVGDEDQCIYAFRGSDTQAMIRFPEEFPGGRILYLRYNYRSSATLVRHANLLIRHNQERYPKEIVNFRQDETTVEGLLLASAREGWARMAKELKGLPRGESCAIILRTNGETEDLAGYLVKQEIPFTLLDQVFDRYARRFYQQFILPLRYALAKEGRKALFLQIVELGPLRLPEEASQRLAKSPDHAEGDLLDEEKYGLSPGQREELIRFFRDCSALRRMKPGQAIRYILYVMGVCKNLESAARQSGASLTELLAEAEAFAREAAAFPSSADFLRYLDAWQEIMARRDPDSQIILSTMHGVKGMEFDRVYVLNAAEGLVPHEKAMGEIEAERRLFYVALTRARHRLILHCPTSCQGRALEISRFVGEAGFVLPGLESQGKSPATLFEKIKKCIAGRRV